MNMAWRLKEKENAFQVTREGPFEYHRFSHGVVYEKIPEEEKDRFEEMRVTQEESVSKKTKGVK
jgi:hypothetical protein